MTEQIMIWLFLLLMPYRWEVNPPSEDTIEAIRTEMIALEVETRAIRQRRTGRGL